MDAAKKPGSCGLFACPGPICVPLHIPTHSPPVVRVPECGVAAFLEYDAHRRGPPSPATPAPPSSHASASGLLSVRLRRFLARLALRFTCRNAGGLRPRCPEPHNRDPRLQDPRIQTMEEINPRKEPLSMLLVPCSCGSQPRAPLADEPLKVVTTIFPPLIHPADSGKTSKVTMLLKPGSESHT